MHYTFLGVAIVSEVIATLLLKLSDGLTKWWWAIVSVFFYSIAGLMLSVVLKYMAVGLVYAIWAGVGITLVCIASVVLLGQLSLSTSPTRTDTRSRSGMTTRTMRRPSWTSELRRSPAVRSAPLTPARRVLSQAIR